MTYIGFYIPLVLCCMIKSTDFKNDFCSFTYSYFLLTDQQLTSMLLIYVKELIADVGVVPGKRSGSLVQLDEFYFEWQ